MDFHIVRAHAADDLFSGLYTSTISLELHEMESRHPNPAYDDKLNWAEEPYWIFGFTNIQQLRFWIYRDYWLEELQEEDFTVSKVYAPREFIQYGRTQAIVDSRKIIEHELIPWAVIMEHSNNG